MDGLDGLGESRADPCRKGGLARRVGWGADVIGKQRKPRKAREGVLTARWR